MPEPLAVLFKSLQRRMDGVERKIDEPRFALVPFNERSGSAPKVSVVYSTDVTRWLL